LGGAHRDFETTMKNVKTVLEQQLSEAQSMTMPDLLSRRFDRIMAYGKFTDK
ncbi:MAG: acetyl-CoA carboxylase carboxyl transferase subunit alpha, partial [Neisseria sp.]|nr:acetyl-CoA carboxylase carboxyl transferase subunit alpha [Neisseria sp.]